jgi:hypothetical protein
MKEQCTNKGMFVDEVSSASLGGKERDAYTKMRVMMERKVLGSILVVND